MTPETLMKANIVIKKISETETLLNSARNQKVEWIDFTFGNGSSRSNVCNDKNQIDIIKSILVTFHEKELLLLKDELEKL